MTTVVQSQQAQVYEEKKIITNFVIFSNKNTLFQKILNYIDKIQFLENVNFCYNHNRSDGLSHSRLGHEIPVQQHVLQLLILNKS